MVLRLEQWVRCQASVGARAVQCSLVKLCWMIRCGQFFMLCWHAEPRKLLGEAKLKSYQSFPLYSKLCGCAFLVVGCPRQKVVEAQSATANRTG